MARFCLILSIVVLVLFLFGGYMLASMITSPETINALSGSGEYTLSMFFQPINAQNFTTFVAWILIMGFVGLMISLSFFVLGRVYEKMDIVERVSRKALRRLSHPEE